MPSITVDLTDTELKCMEYCIVDVQYWSDNALKNRARIAGEDIIAKLVTYCNENSIALAVGKDAQIQQAFDLEIVKTAAELQTQAEAEALANNA